LTKLSLRKHGQVAATCRDFEEDLLTCVAEGRAACILAAQEALGKGLFWGFVTVAQCVMCGLAPNPGGAPLERHRGSLMSNADGTAEYVERKESSRRWFTDTQVVHVRSYSSIHVLYAELCPALPRMADIIISTCRKNAGTG
jgi:hypothetical protein